MSIGNMLERNRTLELVHRSGLFSLLKLMIFLVAAIPLSVSIANAKSKVLPPYVQNQLVQANALIESESYTEASDLLLNLRSKVRATYGLALIDLSLGQLAIYQGDHGAALNFFLAAFKPGILENQRQSQLLHSIAQLHCSIEEWISCREKMQSWIESHLDRVKANDYLMVAKSLAMTESWSELVVSISKAIELHHFAPLAWYQLKVNAWVNQGKWVEAIKAQENLLLHYPKTASEWRRLSGLHLKNDDSQSALSVYRMAFEQDLFGEDKDYRQIASLYLQNKLPFQAAKVFEKGMKSGVLSADESNIQTLVTALLQAKEYRQATHWIEKLLIISPSQKWRKKMAQIYYQESQWRLANKYFNEYLAAADKHNTSDSLKDESIRLMHGITLAHLKRFDEARRQMSQLKQSKRYKNTAESWLAYFNQLG